jgi:hypothetical protein
MPLMMAPLITSCATIAIIWFSLFKNWQGDITAIGVQAIARIARVIAVSYRDYLELFSAEPSG